MSKNRNNTQSVEEEVQNVTAEEAEVVDVEIVDELIDEKPNKWLNRAKKIAPFAIVGGIVATAIAMACSSRGNAICLEAIEAETSDDDDPTDNSDENSDETED